MYSNRLTLYLTKMLTKAIIISSLIILAIFVLILCDHYDLKLANPKPFTTIAMTQYHEIHQPKIDLIQNTCEKFGLLDQSNWKERESFINKKIIMDLHYNVISAFQISNFK
jgi:hypothetical protein